MSHETYFGLPEEAPLVNIYSLVRIILKLRRGFQCHMKQPRRGVESDRDETVTSSSSSFSVTPFPPFKNLRGRRRRPSWVFNNRSAGITRRRPGGARATGRSLTNRIPLPLRRDFLYWLYCPATAHIWPQRIFPQYRVKMFFKRALLEAPNKGLPIARPTQTQLLSSCFRLLTSILLFGPESERSRAYFSVLFCRLLSPLNAAPISDITE